MSHQDWIVKSLGITVVLTPMLVVLVKGFWSLVGHPMRERTIGRFVTGGGAVGLIAALGVLAMMLITGERHVTLEFGNWVVIPGEYNFNVKFVFDRLSTPFVLLSFALVGVVGAFAVRYMHREPGFNRFFMLYALFLLGMIVTSLAGTIETLFAGWELVGLSSALLVAFFHERPGPVRNGLRVWSVYRLSDAALLMAAIAMHHMKGGGDFDKLLGSGAWPEGHSDLTQHQALVVGLLLLVAAAGKSALVPFSGWLPRAMEGPTPSSAVFYGALSVHLGAFLLLRISPILEQSALLETLVVLVGLTTAALAAFAGRAQTDIKSALSYASLTQVGIIVAEIGFGLRIVPLVHILGHGCLRTLQFVRAPSLLHDYRIMENAMGARLPRLSAAWEKVVPPRASVMFYRAAMERGYLDNMLSDYVVEPTLKILRVCDRLERAWLRLLAGHNAPPTAVPPAEKAEPATTTVLEDLA